jgi:hypothetical protein
MIFWNSSSLKSYFEKKILLIICIIRGEACYHFIEKHSKKIPIDCLTMAKLHDHFWGQVGVGATKRFGAVLELSHTLF